MNLLAQDSPFKKPDFAFPKQVTETWQKELDKGLKLNDNPLIMRSLLNLWVASTEISHDNRAPFLKKLSDLSQKSGRNPELHALIDLLQAEIYCDIYTDDRWTYDRRKLPLTPLPDDFTEWSGDQFRYKISSLLKSALSSPEPLVKTPLTKYKGVITPSKYPMFYPSLLSFVAYKALSINSNAGDSFDSGKEIRNLTYRALLNCQPANSPELFMAFVQSDDTKEPMIDIYRRYKDKWYSGLALLKSSELDSRSRYFEMKEYMKLYPESPLNDCMKCEMQQLMEGRLRYNMPEKVAKGVPFDLSVDIENIPRAHLMLYTIKEVPARYGTNKVLDKQVCDTLIVNDIDGPFKKRVKLQFTAPDYGQYTVVALPEGIEPNFDGGYLRTITCSDLFLMVASAPTADNLSLFSTFVADFTTGLPMEGVKVMGDTIRNKPHLHYAGTTDQEGRADIFAGYRVRAEKGADKWAQPVSVSSTRYTPLPDVMSTVTTSLPIYHFGDEVEWLAVVYNFNTPTGNKVLPDKELSVTLLNANGTEVTSVIGKTDSWGRMTGKFTLPVSGLAGNFMIRITYPDEARVLGGTRFVVSDYKLPTFTVEIRDIRRNSPEPDAVTLSGLAQTYSHFPVANAKVMVNVEISDSWRWWFSSRKNLTNIEAVTDDAGIFTVTIPADTLRAHAGDRAVYVTASVTSPGGETRAASATFVMGKPYYISADIDNNLEVSTPANLNIGFMTPTFDKVNLPATLKLYRSVPETNNDEIAAFDFIEIAVEDDGQSYSREGEPAYSFTLADSSKPVDLSKVESGMYDFVIAPVDTTLAEPLTVRDIFVYDKNQSDFPLDEMAWTPFSDGQTIMFHSQTGEILVGTDRENLNMLCIVATNDSLISTRWISFRKGMNHLALTLPDGVTEASVNLSGVNNGDVAVMRYKIVTPGNTRSLDFKIESFRDKVTPLSTETWKFRANMIQGTDTVGTPAAVMLRLFSQAVNDLAQMRDIHFFSPRATVLTGFFSMRNNRFSNYYSTPPTMRSPIYPFVSFPSFELYRYSDTDYECERIYAEDMLMANTTVKMASTNFDHAAPAVVRSFKEEVMTDEEAAEAETGGSGADTQKEQYRPSEVPLALFEPMLVTNPDGTLEYSVTFPDASTTWLLNATAYTDRVYSANVSERIVAAHPLMVQTSLPRFMRLGDKATLSATIMNNSGENLPEIATRFEAIDPATGSVMSFAEERISLDNGQMKVVSMQLYADRLSPGLIIRAKASGGKYADGEQAMIAVLEASQPVYETTPFYLNPSQKSTHIDVNAGNDAKVTLEFYQNPTWSVVTALPGLRHETYTTPIDAAAAIGSAAIAENLLKRNPGIATAIRQWLDSDRSDSTLVSMLERNPDLKIALLEATPWITDAMNDTQRMQRLALLFDRKEIAAVYATAIESLAQLQRSKGWAWVNIYNDPDEWATAITLEILGYIKSLGYLPDDKRLDSMIKNAVEYFDSQVIEKSKLRGKPYVNMTYPLIRAPFTNVRQPSAARAVTEATIQNTIAHWKEYSTRDKAFAAIILAQHNYHSTARHIVSSIAEFAIETPYRGIYWDKANIGTTARILQAYALTGQPREQIDAIRQWLILNKAANNWGNSIDTSCIIYNILATGSQWTSLSPGSTLVKVDDTEFMPDKVDNITGYFRADLSQSFHGEPVKIGIFRTGDTPAYGSVYTVSTQQMDSIQAASCPELSISKRFLVRVDSADGETWRESTEFHVGDVVKVSMTIKVTEEMQYVTIIDNRAGTLEPVNQLPENLMTGRSRFYRQTDNSSSRCFTNYLPKGTYILEQTFTVTHPGEFTSGIATIQSQYAPQYTAHSAGFILKVTD